jgi:hypothetical protein
VVEHRSLPALRARAAAADQNPRAHCRTVPAAAPGGAARVSDNRPEAFARTLGVSARGTPHADSHLHRHPARADPSPTGSTRRRVPSHGLSRDNGARPARRAPPPAERRVAAPRRPNRNRASARARQPAPSAPAACGGPPRPSAGNRTARIQHPALKPLLRFAGWRAASGWDANREALREAARGPTLARPCQPRAVLVRASSVLMARGPALAGPRTQARRGRVTRPRPAASSRAESARRAARTAQTRPRGCRRDTRSAR